MLDRGCRNESIGQFHCPMNTGGPAVRDKPSPRHHHRLTDGDRIGCARQREGVGTSCSDHRVEGLAGEVLEFIAEARVCRAFGKFVAETLSGQPSGATRRLAVMRAAEDDLDYLRRIETLARAVCDCALEEGWLSYEPDPEDATALQQSVNALARRLRHHHSADDGCCS